MTLTEEQQRYLDARLRHREWYYGSDIGKPPGGHLTLALAWWANWWKDRADRAADRDHRARRGDGDLFDVSR